MSVDKEGLTALEQLLNQFFDVKTGNDKRQEIERLLLNFENQHGSWRLCIEYLAHTENHYAGMFCLTTLGNIINKQWMCLPWEEKAQLRSLIYNYLIEQNKSLSFCVKSKLVKLIVDIARLDWPHFYTDFFVNVLQLMEKSETRSLGLLFMLTTSEELLAPREDVSVDRKTELKKLLLAQIPQVFSILTELLSSETILSDTQDCSLLLRVFTHLFSWVPAAHVPNSVIRILFNLGSKTDKQDLALLAISTLNEILYRHWVPPNWNQIISHTMELLQTLLNSSLVKLDYSYLEKVIDFLRLVLGIEMSQNVEKQDNLNILLGATLNFTMQQPTLDPGFIACLDIWTHLLEYSNCKKYKGAFVCLAQHILNKIQFQLNRNELIKLDDSVPDGGEEGSLIKFKRTCIEIIAKIADIEPYEILRLVFEKWIELCRLYGEIFSNFSQVLQNVTAIHSLLKDLSTFTQAIGRLYPHCTGESWKEEPNFTIARLTIQHLLTLHDLTTKVHQHTASADVKLEFQNLHAEVLASLKSWCYWLPLLHTESSTKSFLNEFVTNIVNGCVPLLDPEFPVVLQHCSAHLISTITSTVRPSCLWDLESIKCLFSCNLNHLQKEDQYLIQGSLVNCLILKWPSADDQMWDHRLKLLVAYINELTNPFIALPLQFNLEFRPLIISMLQVLQYVIKLYKSEGMKSKKLLCIAFQKSVEHSLALFPIYVKDAEVNQEILQFFLVLLECLQQQVGVTFTQVTVQTFMDVYTRQQLQVSLAHENGGGLQQLLQILDLVVQTPGLSASKLTPMAVNLCLQLSEPILSLNVSPTVQESLFQLVYSILVHKWHYFFKTTLETELRRKEFLQLMKAIGQSLFLQNIDLFRQNLKNLERLNNKWNLYYKEIFKKELHGEFLKALFNILIAKSHSLINEEIAVVIYNLIMVDTESFFNAFLPRYLDSIVPLSAAQKTVLLDNFKHDTDMPSMIENIFRLTNDLIYYQLYNSSASLSTVKLNLVCSILASSLSNFEKPVKCLEGIGVCGINGMLWEKHFGEDVDVTINGYYEEDYNIITKNLELNKMRGKIVKEDPCILLRKNSYDFIYLNCKTNASLYFDSVFANISSSAILIVTTSEDPSLYWQTADIALRNYGGLTGKTSYNRETSVRLVIAEMARAAAKYQKGLKIDCTVAYKPQQSFTIIGRVKKGVVEANACIQRIKKLAHCTLCESRAFLTNSAFLDKTNYDFICGCSKEAEGKVIMGIGPLWAGDIFDAEFIEKVLQNLNEFPWKSKVFSLLNLILEEARCEGPNDECSPPHKKTKSDEQSVLSEDSSNSPCFYINTHRQGSKVIQLEKLSKIINLLKRNGYRASRTHFDSEAVRTNAPVVECVRLLRRNSGLEL